MKKVCVFYYGSWSSSIRDRFVATKPMYVILDLSSWPSVPTADIATCKNAGITMCAYIPTGGMRGFIWSAADTTVKTPANIKALVDQAYSRGFNGVFFDEGGLYTPVSGQTWQDTYLDRYLQAPGKGAGNPPILSVVGNSKYNPTTADPWLGLTVEEYISHAKGKGMFVVVGCPDEYARSSRINSNIFSIVDAILTSEEYNTRTPGLAPVGQEIPFTGKCFVLSYNGTYDAAATNAALNYGFGAAYCCASMGTLPSPAYENYMTAITESTPPPTPAKIQRALFRWDVAASDLSNTGGVLDKFKQFLQTYGFNEIYLYLYDVHLTGTTNANNLNSLIGWCHTNGIKAWGIINQGGVTQGPPVVAPDPTKDQALITAYLNYQSSHTNKFDGMMFDIETLTNIVSTMTPYMTAVKGYAYNGQTLVTQGWQLGIYIDPPYYLTNPRGTGYAAAKTLYSYFNKILLNTYRPTAPETVVTAQDGPKACSELGIQFLIGLESLPGWGNSFTGAVVDNADIPVYYSMLDYIDNATETNIAPYKSAYGGTYLDAYQYVKGWTALPPVSNTFPTGTPKTAAVPITINPTGIACECEVFLGPNSATKSATSGKISFTSTGAVQTINCPITMPAVAGVYHAYINITSGGVLFAAFADPADVTVTNQISGSISGPIVWN